MNMHKTGKTTIAGGIILLMSFGTGLAAAQEHSQDESKEGHSHEMSEIHGGSVTMTPMHHFEALFTDDGVRLYVYDAKQKPMMNPKMAKVSVTLEPREGKPIDLPLQYAAPDTAKGTTQGYFMAKHDFSKVGKGNMKAMFHVEGLTDKPIEFKTAVATSEPAMYSCAMHPKMMASDPLPCPVCGMTMTRADAHHEEMHEHTESSGHGGH